MIKVPIKPAEITEEVNVQFGAGWSAPAGWLNYDASPSIWLERLPVLGRFIKVNAKRFPEDVLYGDIVKGLPVKLMSAKAVYASHVLEHLSYNDCRTALRNTFAMLKPGGVFRLIVPDLEARIRNYQTEHDAGDGEAGNNFCRSTLFGIEQSPKGTLARIRSLMGLSHHLWMWDEKSMSRALLDAGFTGVRRCKMGDSSEPAFAKVEDPHRFFDERRGIVELALEATRPLA